MTPVKNEEWWGYGDPPWGTGSAYSISGDGSEPDVIDRLREVAEEVTGVPVPRQPVRKIGFY